MGKLDVTVRKICYISGTRADFGLMRSTLTAIRDAEGLDLNVIVTGMHLNSKYGHTITDIEEAGLAIIARVQVDMEEASGVNMARNIGTMVAGFAGVLAEQRPDVVLLLGDRGEMLAGALAAIHLNIPVVHIHGGERSGTIDEPVRHAISKLSHFHFTATADARARLIRMGESASNVYVIGAPGIDGIVELAQESRGALCAIFGFDPARPLALFVYHPVVQESDCDGKEVAEILDLLISRGIQVVALRPNSDAGSDAIRTRLESRASHALVHLLTHMGRARFAAMMAEADVMIGNSSAGIIEAASFGIPVVNIGSRQNLRERNKNVRDVDLNLQAIGDAIDRAMQAGRYPRTNIYGDGQAARRIVALLQNIPLDNTVLMKTNAY